MSGIKEYNQFKMNNSEITPKNANTTINGVAAFNGVVLGAQGIAWDEIADTYTRRHALAGYANSASPGNAALGGMYNWRRCLLQDDGQVYAYIDGFNITGIAPDILGTDDAGTAFKVSDNLAFGLAAGDYVGHYVHNTTDNTYAMITAKDDDNVLSIDTDIMAIGNTFEICTAQLGAGVGGIDNQFGQVMVEIPKVLHRYQYDGTTHIRDYSQTPMYGFEVHPAFIKNGEEVDYRYCSAFEGSMWDASAGAMVAPANIITNMYTAGDKLCSLAGQFPKVNETRAEFRGMAATRGTGWRLLDYDLMHLIQAEYLNEYANFNSQNMIGMGRANLSGGSFIADSYIGKCGMSVGIGNNTGAVQNGGSAGYLTDYMSYRGVENFYGNVWTWIDGINIDGTNVSNYIAYVSNNDTDFVDDTATNYIDLGIVLPSTTGWQNTLQQISRGFLPASVGATSSTKITDYWNQLAGNWRMFRVGGASYNGNYVGMFYTRMGYGSTGNDVNIGSRLAF